MQVPLDGHDVEQIEIPRFPVPNANRAALTMGHVLGQLQAAIKAGSGVQFGTPGDSEAAAAAGDTDM